MRQPFEFCLLWAAMLAAQTASPQRAWHEGLTVAPAAVGQTPNTATFGGRVDFAGQPPAEDFARYAQRGVRTVINLRTKAEMDRLGFDEKEAVEKAGMKYLHVPVGGEPPGPGDLEGILTLLDNAGQSKVLLHCASSVRVGMIWSILRARRHGLPTEQAVAEGRLAGMTSAAAERRTREFLSQSKQ